MEDRSTPSALPMPILTARLRLEPLNPSHAEQVFAYRSQPEVRRFQGSFAGSPSEVRKRGTHQLGRLPLEEPGWFQLVIVLDEKVIGDIGLHALDSDQVEIGITLDPRSQGNGYATEALRAALDAVFAIRHRVLASVDPANTPCMALMERLGLRKEAHHRQSIRTADGWTDDVVFALLASEWNQQKA